MIIEHRTYDFQPRKMAAWLSLYESEGLPVQERHLGRLIGFFTTEIGPLYQVIHLWSYANLEDRTTRRAAMAQDPDWRAFLEKSAELGAMVRQENKILLPTAFSPIQ